MPVSQHDALVALSNASTRLHPDDIVRTARRVARASGLHDLLVYLADLEQRVLLPVPEPTGTDGRPPPLVIDATLAGRAYRTGRPVAVFDGDGQDTAGGRTALWFPLLDSAERLGVVSAEVEGQVTEADLQGWAAFVSLLGEIIANKLAYGDMLIATRRTKPLSLAAEMRWAMVPPTTFVGRNLSISGAMLPPYEIAGDTFDYAVNGPTARVAIIDAVGHGLEAARIANIAVSAYRNGRRRGAVLPDKYRHMDEVVATEFGWEKFATAQLAKLRLATGELEWINAGHPEPMIVRRGHRIDLSSTISLPLGLGDREPTVNRTALEPNDLVLFFTDGVIEARSPRREEFGRERLADFLVRAAAGGQTAAETVRMLSHGVLAHQEGALQDDATLLLLTWFVPDDN